MTHLFVGGCSSDTTCEGIREEIRERTPSSVELTEVTELPVKGPMKAFRIYLNKSEVDELMGPGVWMEGVKIKPFKHNIS